MLGSSSQALEYGTEFNNRRFPEPQKSTTATTSSSSRNISDTNKLMMRTYDTELKPNSKTSSTTSLTGSYRKKSIRDDELMYFTG